MKISNCCEAPFHEPGYPDNDICSKCLEHAEPIDEDTMQKDEIENYEDEHTCKHGNSRASNCSDCDCEEKDDTYHVRIDLKNREREKRISMISCIGYRGEE